jgi:hypothetical protein
MWKRILCLTVILATTCSISINAQTAPLTLEWILGEGRTVAAVPSHFWMADGRLMIYDGRVPLAQRTFETLDLKTNERRKAFDVAALSFYAFLWLILRSCGNCRSTARLLRQLMRVPQPAL